MLLELGIRNFAVIDKINISFGEGLNILTGETGAGKSIIVDSIELLLGNRTSSDIVRSGEKEATIEGSFEVDTQLAKLLQEMGIENSDTLIIRRVISREGKNKVYINGTISNLLMLSKFREHLIDIHGQHENQSLLIEECHLYILDKFGELEPLRDELSNYYNEYKKLGESLRELEDKEKKKEESKELLQFQSKEIGIAGIEVGEDEKLESKRKILINSEKIFQKITLSEEILYSGSTPVIEQLKSVLKSLGQIKNFDAEIEKELPNLENSLFTIEDTALFLRNYLSRMDFDNQKLEEIEKRLFFLNGVKRKYGQTLSEVLEYKSRIDQELVEMDSLSSTIDVQKRELIILQDLLYKSAEKLSLERIKIANLLRTKIECELSLIGMKNATFIVEVQDKEGDNKIGLKGKDRVRFLISTNQGEEPKPLSKIASGGELSRIMLGLRRVLLDRAPIPTIVFDEIDQGVGGAQAEIIGKKLKEVAKYHQVICVTHLPQIASFGNNHFAVTKVIQNLKTNVAVEKLKEVERVDEISRMIGGTKISGKTKEVAREMIERSR